MESHQILGIERKRTIISSFFITILTGIAFHHSVSPIWEIFREKGLSLSIEWVIPYIFIITTIRFFIGNQLHILNVEKQLDLFEWIWLFDFTFITAEAFILIFAGTSCSLSICLNAKTDFFSFIRLLLIVDIIWIFFQIIFGIINKKWKRKVVPWGWGILNFGTLIFLLILGYKSVLYSKIGLALSGLTFTIATLVDVLLIDHYGLLKKTEKGGSANVFMKAAIKEANLSLKEGGIPIGAVLVKNNKIIGKGHNRRLQDNDPMAHAEIVCLRDAGRIRKYNDTTLYSTLMPCYLCAGAIVQFGIKRVVVGESQTFSGAQEFMRNHGVKVIDLDLAECKKIMNEYIQKHLNVWYEDIGALS